MLDPEMVQAAKPYIQNQGISLAEYIRNLMEKDIQSKHSTQSNKKKMLLNKAGSITSSGDGKEAINHNDIYGN
jgi:hypothetical protein